MKENQTENFALPETGPATDTVLAIDIEKITPNPYQPRREIAPDRIDELAQSIKANGLIQPVVVRRSDSGGYQLVVGERRFLACRKLGWRKISAAVKTLSDQEMAAIALIENLQRENLSYIEEAYGYVSLINNFALTQEMLAQRLGKSQSTIANKIRLLRLSKKVQDMLIKQGLTERHARALLRLESEEQQVRMIREVAERGLTVSQAEKRIEKLEENEGSERRARRSKTIVRDMRIVLNTIREAVSIMQGSGLYPEVLETIEPDYIEVTIRLTREMIRDAKG